MCFFLLSAPCFGQAWSGIISPARAADWTAVGMPGDITPDISGSWTQIGPTVAACGSNGSPVSPSTCGITAALAACGTNHFVLLAGTVGTPADFYLNADIPIPSNCVLRGGGANATRVHFANGGTYACDGTTALVCLGVSDYFAGDCVPNQWPCPTAQWTQVGNQANWIAGFSQGSTSITLDSVTGITPNLTVIAIDQCDTGYSGTPGIQQCTGVDGAITSVTVNAAGTGYAVGDTGTIGCSINWGSCYGALPAATYSVTSVSGGTVTGVSITSGGGGYTTNSTAAGQPYVTTAKTTGSGSGLQLFITGVTPYDNGGLFACAITMQCTYLSEASTTRNARSQEETFVATAISGSGPYTVTLDHPIAHPNWASSQAPEAFWGTSGGVVNLGVENMEIDGSAITGGGCSNPGCATSVIVNNAYKAWITGIASNISTSFHVNATYVENMLIANNYFYWTPNASVISYGIGSLTAIGHSLFENNIIQGVVDPVNFASPCTGCVAAYNFTVNDYDTASTALFASNPMHAAMTDYILEEGNIGAGTQMDGVHGPHYLNTFFRNYFNGYESNNGTLPTQSTVPAIANAFSRYNNFLGNVLGTAGYHTIYECIPASSSQHYCSTDAGSYPGNVHIWDLGFGDTSQRDFANTPYFSPNDLTTASSTYRYGNCDVVSTPSCQFNSSEVPTSDPHFPNSVPASHAMPASFYDGVTTAYASCGTGLAFWKNPTTGTCPQYPPVGPDVTAGDVGMCTSGVYNWARVLTNTQCAGGGFTPSVNGGYANSNPAMRCYLNQMGGTPDGTGSYNANFNAAACYAQDSGSLGAPPSGSGPPPAPNPPTDLTATVQ